MRFYWKFLLRKVFNVRWPWGRVGVGPRSPTAGKRRRLSRADTVLTRCVRIRSNQELIFRLAFGTMHMYEQRS